MARISKPGIEYFPVDTNLDEKFDLIEAKYGLNGFGVVMKLYQNAYRNYGYFYPWTGNEQLLFAKRIGMPFEQVNLIVQDAVIFKLFDKELFQKGILTSSGIQKRYIEITKRRRDISFFEDLLLVDVNIIPQNVNNIARNVAFLAYFADSGTQSKVKESKVKESKVNYAADAVCILKEAVNYLNLKAGTNYKPTSEATRRHGQARIAEGYTLADFKKVIDNKCAEWLGSEWEKYLRPVTLFGTKFENYLNQKTRASSSETIEERTERIRREAGI